VEVSVIYLPGVSDRFAAATMSVFENPIHTLPRYQRGIKGAAASLPRLEDAVAAWDELATAAVLADMAASLGLKASDLPGRHPDLAAVDRALGELEEALGRADEPLVRRLVSAMLRHMGQGFPPSRAAMKAAIDHILAIPVAA
jgi:hypothetical protein